MRTFALFTVVVTLPALGAGCGSSGHPGAISQSNSSAASQSSPLPVPKPPPPPDAGQVILMAKSPFQVPLTPALFTATSGWANVRGYVEISLYAGVSPSNPTMGEVLLFEQDQRTGRPVRPSGLYKDPGAGTLTLTSVSNGKAHFSSSAGRGGTFDLRSAAFAGH